MFWKYTMRHPNGGCGPNPVYRDRREDVFERLDRNTSGEVLENWLKRRSGLPHISEEERLVHRVRACASGEFAECLLQDARRFHGLIGMETNQ